MTPTEAFTIANAVTLPMWVLMLFLSKWKVTRFLIDFKVIPLTLAFIYAIYIVQAVCVSGMMDFGNLRSVMALFSEENAVLAGWIHYLAFDLLVGMWMLDQNKELKINQLAIAPCLFLTFTLGPIGFLLFMIIKTIKQKQSDYRSVFITLEAGDITSNQLNALADVIREFSSEGMARSGFVQNVALRYVHEDDLISLYSKLIQSGLAKSGALTMTTPIGCSGTTSCNLALTNSHRLAKEIQRKFLELHLDEDEDLTDSSIKISGCPNSCGQHGIATIGFFGGGGRLGKDMYANYQMSLGGRFDGDTTLGQTCLRVP